MISAYSQAFQWALQGGGAGSNTNSDMGQAVATDSQGNVIVTGIFESTAQFGTTSLISAGSNDIFIAKYTADGNFIWAIKAGGTQLDWAKAICTDKNDNILITGMFSGTATFGTSTTLTANSTDIFVAKYNSSGVLQWAKKEGGSSVDRGLAIAADTSGNVIVTGDFSGSVSFGATNLTSAGAADIFLVKYNAAGAMQWAKKAGNVVNDRATAVTTDVAGNIYITGSFGGTVSFGATQLTATGGSNDTDIFTAKYDASGNVVWAKKGGSNSGIVEEARGIALDNAQNIYITGLFGGTAAFDTQNITSNGSSDIFLVKYNNSGTVQWARAGGGANEDEGAAVSTMPDGRICITGFYKGTATFGNITLNAFGGASDFDAFVVNYDNNGNQKWAKTFGRTGEGKATGIKSDLNNRLSVTGFFRSNILFDQIQLTAQGSSDMFLAQLNDFITIDTLASVTYCTGEIIPINFTTSVTFNTSNHFTAWLSNASGSFANAVNIGTLSGTSSGTISGILPDTLSTGSSYKLKIEATDLPTFSPLYFSSITINAMPAKPLPVTPTGFCTGDTLTKIVVTGQDVYWYSDSTLNNLIFNGDTLNVNQIFHYDTTFYCVNKSTTGCYSDVSAIIITVHPLPVITNNLADTNIICTNGAPFTMNLSPTGGVFSGSGILSGAGVFHPDIATVGFHNISYIYSNSYNCSSTYNTYFDVIASPVASIDTTPAVNLHFGDTLFLSGTPSGGTFSGVGVTGNYFVGDDTLQCNPCNIWYIYHAPNGCTDTASVLVSVLNAIDEINNPYHVAVYPNPVQDYVNIMVSSIFQGLISVQLYDLSGRLVYENNFNALKDIKVNLNSLNKGVYFLKVGINQKSFNRVIIR